MGLGYAAFGGQEWIRKLKPRRYFENRKSPLSEDVGARGGHDYQQLVQKQPLVIKNKKPGFLPVQHEQPSGLAYFTILLVMALAIAAALTMYWTT